MKQYKPGSTNWKVEQITKEEEAKAIADQARMDREKRESRRAAATLIISSVAALGAIVAAAAAVLGLFR